MAGQAGNKNKKYGRNAAKCKAYAAAGKRERNKKRKIERHLKKQPNDEQAREALA